MFPFCKTGRDLLREHDLRSQRPLLPTRIEALDVLQGGGFPRGSLVLLAGSRSSGRFTLSLAFVSATTRSGRLAAFLDAGDQFDPAEAEEAGADLSRLLWVRPERWQDALSGAEIVLSAGFAAVVLDLGTGALPLHRVPSSAWQRLARAAERHDNVLLVVSPRLFHVPSARVVLGASARPVWEGSRPVLAGLSARVSLQQPDGRERTGLLMFDPGA